MTDYAREAAEQISARLFGRGDEPMTRIIEPFIAAAIEAATQDLAAELAALRTAPCEICGRCTDEIPYVMCCDCRLEYSQPAKETP